MGLAIMAAFKTSGKTGKNENGEKSIEAVFKDFKAVKNPILYHILLLLPLLILLIITLIILMEIFHFFWREGTAWVVMNISAYSAVALSLFAFYVFMKMIPETFHKLWCHDIIVETPPDLPPKIVDSNTSKVTAQMNRPLEERFYQFIQKMQLMLNSPLQWVTTGIAFGLLTRAWNDWDQILTPNYFSSLRSSFAELTDLWDQALVWGGFVYYNWNFFTALINFFIGYIIGLMVWRMLVTVYYIWKLGEEFNIEPKLGHPDMAGGLLPLGNLCLWNAFIISIPAIYLGGWLLLKFFMEKLSPFQELAEYYTPLYFCLLFILVVIPLVFFFFLPLWKVHWLMEEWRNKQQARMDQLANSIDQLESRLLNETEKIDSKEFEKIQKELEKMQQVYARNSKLPVWPFNMKIKLKLLALQIVPILGFISQVVSLIEKIPG